MRRTGGAVYAALVLTSLGSVGVLGACKATDEPTVVDIDPDEPADVQRLYDLQAADNVAFRIGAGTLHLTEVLVFTGDDVTIEGETELVDTDGDGVVDRAVPGGTTLDVTGITAAPFAEITIPETQETISFLPASAITLEGDRATFRSATIEGPYEAGMALLHLSGDRARVSNSAFGGGFFGIHIANTGDGQSGRANRFTVTESIARWNGYGLFVANIFVAGAALRGSIDRSLIERNGLATREGSGIAGVNIEGTRQSIVELTLFGNVVRNNYIGGLALAGGESASFEPFLEPHLEFGSDENLVRVDTEENVFAGNGVLSDGTVVGLGGIYAFAGDRHWGPDLTGAPAGDTNDGNRVEIYSKNDMFIDNRALMPGGTREVGVNLVGGISIFTHAPPGDDNLVALTLDHPDVGDGIPYWAMSEWRLDRKFGCDEDGPNGVDDDSDGAIDEDGPDLVDNDGDNTNHIDATLLGATQRGPVDLSCPE
jgi:hypothetical protein